MDGGDTAGAEPISLVHHRLVHEGAIAVATLPDGGWRFLHPDGRHFEPVRGAQSVAYGADNLEQAHTALGIDIDSDTAATRWRGERMDYDLGVWVLCQQAERARIAGDKSADVPAGTSANASRTNLF
jgi:hypothetical protein